MENASKALLIAGGILLAIIILSLIVGASKNLSTIKESEDQQREIKQLEEFNKGYEINENYYVKIFVFENSNKFYNDVDLKSIYQEK